MARPNKSGVYNAIMQKFPLSERGTTQRQAFLLECGHVVLDPRDTIGGAQAAQREKKWCFLCTEAERKRMARAQAQSKAQGAKADAIIEALPPGAMVLTEEQLAKLVAKASERAVNAALDRLTQPQPVFPETASGGGGGTGSGT